MGASSSKAKEDRSLELCLDRMKFVKKALHSRRMLAEAHVNYMWSLRDTGRVIKELFEPEVPIESDLHDTTGANNVPNERHLNGGSPLKGEGRVASQVTESVIVINDMPDKTSGPNEPAKTSPWDYFDLSRLVEDTLSSQKINGCKQGLDRIGKTKTTLDAKDEGNTNKPDHNIFQSEDGYGLNFVLEMKNSDKYTKDCGEPQSENINTAYDIMDAVSSPSLASASTEISDIFPMGKSRSPDLSPLREIASSVSTNVTLSNLADIEEADIQENIVEHKASPNALYSSMKDINQLFIKASESGQEVLRMLEANNLNLFHQLPTQKVESRKSWCQIACFSRQENPYQVSDESCLPSKRYLASQRNISARSFSTIASHIPRYGLANSSDDIHCMRSGSHVCSLDRLYAWENKLYEEVKASQIIRRQYDLKCKLLRHQEDKAESAKKIEKTRAVIKDLHSSIRVSIKRMETISRIIIGIRDSELQPQFEEFIRGLSNMWQKMHEFHERQFEIISAALSIPTAIAINTGKHQLMRYHLEQQLNLTSSNYIRLVFAYHSYIKEIEGWLCKCVVFPENSSKKTRKRQSIPTREYSPPIFVTSRIWLEGLEKLAAEASRLSPRQDKHHSQNLENTVNPVDESANFSTSLIHFFSQLKTFSESSTNMYKELDNSIQEAAGNYEPLL